MTSEIKAHGVVPLSTGGHATIIIFSSCRPCRRVFTGPDSLQKANDNLAQVMGACAELRGMHGRLPKTTRPTTPNHWPTICARGTGALLIQSAKTEEKP